MKKRSGGASGEAARRAAARGRPEWVARRAAEDERRLVAEVRADQAMAVEFEGHRVAAISRRNAGVVELRQLGWSRSAVARALGISRQALAWPSGTPTVDALGVEWGPG